MKTFSALPVCLGLFSLLTWKSLGATEVDQSSFSETTYDADIVNGAATDLLYQRPITTTGGPNLGFALTGMNDGLAGSGSSPGTYTTGNPAGNDTYFDNGDFGNMTLAGNPVVTITLDTTATGSLTGYTLSKITTINGWQNFDLSFSDQAYSVYYSTVAAPSTFTLLDTVNYHPFGNRGDQFDQETNRDGSNTANSDTSSSEVNLTGLGVSNVAALEFVLAPSTGGSYVPFFNPQGLSAGPDTQGGSVIREFQAFGTPSSVVPEPSTYAMVLAGVAGLAFLVRRKIFAA